MKIQKVFLYLSLAIFMVFSLSLVTADSFAYWAGSDTSVDASVTAIVEIGEWNQVFEYDENASYSKNDLVIHNGVTYKAKRNNPSTEPGVDRRWTRDWKVVN